MIQFRLHNCHEFPKVKLSYTFSKNHLKYISQVSAISQISARPLYIPSLITYIYIYMMSGSARGKNLYIHVIKTAKTAEDTLIKLLQWLILLIKKSGKHIKRPDRIKHCLNLWNTSEWRLSRAPWILYWIYLSIYYYYYYYYSWSSRARVSCLQFFKNKQSEIK
jgi:hypothetical protein